MTIMPPKTIETLTSDVDQIKSDIEALKAVVDQKAEIESRISSVKSALDQKMEAFKDSTDVTEKEEYEKAKILSESLAQLSSLVVSILSNQPSQTSSETVPVPVEKKGLREKTKDMRNE
jgi:hypothetical protein